VLALFNVSHDSGSGTIQVCICYITTPYTSVLTDDVSNISYLMARDIQKTYKSTDNNWSVLRCLTEWVHRPIKGCLSVCCHAIAAMALATITTCIWITRPDCYIKDLITCNKIVLSFIMLIWNAYTWLIVSYSCKQLCGTWYVGWICAFTDWYTYLHDNKLHIKRSGESGLTSYNIHIYYW